MSERDERAHLNLIESSRQLFELDPEVVLEPGAGWLFGAGRSPHPAISNAAFRSDDGLNPEDFLARAKAFFDRLGRGFSVWARAGRPEDRDLIDVAEAAGLNRVHTMPEMVLGSPAEEAGPGLEVELRRVGSRADADEFWRVAVAAYASIGFPAEVFSYYVDHTRLTADNTAAFLARLDGEPVAISMTIVNHGVAGVYWVGSVERARGRGLGRAMTVTATNAGFEMGAEFASLQASEMGEGIYAAIGYESIYDYCLLMAKPPGAGR